MSTFELTPFEERLAEAGKSEFCYTIETLSTLQLNIGSKCNLNCKHCHVKAGPDRTEEMSKDVMGACLKVAIDGGISTIDITGGAPEMNSNYRWLINEAFKNADRVITRTNLAILTEDGCDDLPRFWAERGVEVVASLPSWVSRNTDRQRGDGAFDATILGMKMLNTVGYGKGQKNNEGTPLRLNLVTNPGGAFLPPAQASAEREFKEKLASEYEVSFDNLLTITNNPIGRFAEFLVERDKYDDYMKRLSLAFNPDTVENMMCRFQLSVDANGNLFDCDFNQAANLPIEGQGNVLELARLGAGAGKRKLRLGNHCYACTAGAGSSCGGTTA